MAQEPAQARSPHQQLLPHAGRAHSRGGLFALAAALVMLVGVIAGCAGSSSASAQVTSTPRATATPTLPPTTEGRLTQRARLAVGTAAQRVDVSYQAASGAAQVTVTLVWSPAWKTNFAQAQTAAKLACYRAQAALWTSGVSLSKVTVLVMGQTLDDYAEVIMSAYAEADLIAQHARDIAWSTISAEQAWARYDHVFLRPTYAPNWIYVPGRR